MKSIIYIVRKNRLFYQTDYYHVGNATQILKTTENFQDARLTMLTELKDTLSELTDNVHELDQSKYHYYLRNFMKYGSLNSKQRSWGFDYGENKYHSALKNLDDVELFNYLYPTRAVEIILSQNDYLLSPAYNSKYFELHNKPMPKSQLEGNPEDCQYLDKCLFVDKEDYFNNVLSGSNRNKLVSFYKGIEFNEENYNNIDILREWFQYGNFVIKLDNSSIVVDNNIHYTTLLAYDDLLKEKPITFKKVAMTDVFDYQVEEFESIITDYAKDRYYVYDDPVIQLTGGIFDLSLNRDFVLRFLEKIKTQR